MGGCSFGLSFSGGQDLSQQQQWKKRAGLGSGANCAAFWARLPVLVYVFFFFWANVKKVKLADLLRSVSTTRWRERKEGTGWKRKGWHELPKTARRIGVLDQIHASRWGGRCLGWRFVKISVSPCGDRTA